MSRPADLLRQAAYGTGLAAAIKHHEAIESLTFAIDETARLADLLEAQVTELERSLVPMLQADQRARQR
ncbi:hypothetical protein [Nocardioides conyzicola]|uniref:DUF892 family protein n=1 Tax=Nocardioides conyzicola TaxID=1651781 RepID=A0ABP8WVW2_9ACTN